MENFFTQRIFLLCEIIIKLDLVEECIRYPTSELDWETIALSHVDDIEKRLFMSLLGNLTNGPWGVNLALVVISFKEDLEKTDYLRTALCRRLPSKYEVLRTLKSENILSPLSRFMEYENALRADPESAVLEWRKRGLTAVHNLRKIDIENVPENLPEEVILTGSGGRLLIRTSAKFIAIDCNCTELRIYAPNAHVEYRSGYLDRLKINCDFFTCTDIVRAKYSLDLIANVCEIQFGEFKPNKLSITSSKIITYGEYQKETAHEE